MRRGLLLLALSATSAFGQYLYSIQGDSFSTIDTTKWWVNPANSGTLNGSATGLYGNGSLISKVAVPDGSSDYEVKATFVPITNNGLGHLIYLRASNDAAGSCGNSGTYYSVQMYDNFGGLGVIVWKRVGGIISQLDSRNVIPLTSPITVRASIRSDGPSAGITIRVGTQSWFVGDTSITSGQPGVGVATCGSTGYPSRPFSRVDIGPIDRVGPNQVSSAVVTGSFPDKTILSWPATTDDANGVGVQRYHILRDGVWLTSSTSTMYTDETVAPATTYTYTIVAEDWHGTIGTPRNLTVTTPSYLDWDPRRTGITPTGSYWGAMGEQIDTQSGNLNFTLPLLKVMGKGSWSQGINLTYNSQLWRYLSSPTPGTINHGADVGYGFGWRLLAGAIFPFYSGTTFSHYVFLDSTGGEHKLNFNDGGVWRGASGLQVRYDENLSRLYFNDGSFWQMDCISAGTEQDAGTRYPTLMKDVNGNQVILKYMPSIGSTTINTSSRIKEIQDIRAVYNYWSGSYGARTFQFTYNADPIPHLTKIENTIGTSEKYDFTYSTPVSLTSPFDGSVVSGSAVPMLLTTTVTGLSLGHTFEYANTSGELTKAIFPYGGELRYDYTTFTFAAGHKLREVGSRYLVKQSGSTPKQYAFVRNASDSSLPVHSAMTVVDPDGQGVRSWTFTWDGTWRSGLTSGYYLISQPGFVVRAKEEFTWALAPSGFPYIGATVSTTDVGTANEKVSKTEQTIDGYGNLIQKKDYNYGNLTVPAKTTNCTYYSTPALISANLFNLVNTCTLTAGSQTYTLVTREYDAKGNPTKWKTLGKWYQTATYNSDGSVAQSGPQYGMQTTYGYNPSSGGLPTQITPDANSQLQGTLGYTSFLGLSNASQANGTSVAFTYDSYARPKTQSTPDGPINFTYAASAPWWKQAALGTAWTKTWFDGLGRVIKEEKGDAGGTKATVETEYDSCSCSPLGKMKRASRPYAPGGTVYWTTYTYDAMGRTISVAQPNSSGTTSYNYQGNTVTVTSPTSRWKKFTSDALGNLIQVNEPNPAGGADYVTSYTYNALGKLTDVLMPRPTGTQTRNFVYNTEGQLTSETHPETGNSTYTYGTYNDFDLVKSKTDAKSQRTEWTYDVYRRVRQERHYNALNAELTCERVDYGYDGYAVPPVMGGISPTYSWGRLTEMTWGDLDPSVCSPIGQIREQYGYDFQGRMIVKSLRVKQKYTSTTAPSFDGEGHIDAWWTWANGAKSNIIYPGWHYETTYTPPGGFTGTYGDPRSGGMMTYTFNEMRQLSGMTTSGGAVVLVDNVQYGPAGELTQIRYNGVNETRGYNELGQLKGISYNGVLRHEYRYSSTANDGRLVSYKNWQSGEDVQYQYDSLTRLTSAQTSAWSQTYSYDGFGNLTEKIVTAGTPLSVAIDPSKNRITGVTGLTYDANGNMTGIPGIGTVAYDGRNRQIGTNLTGAQLPTRGYDPSNRKIWTTDQWGRVIVDFYLPTGEKLGSYRLFKPDYRDPNTGCCDEKILFQKETDYLYFSGRLIKTDKVFPSPTWINQDRLGSTVPHLPYGEERTVTAQDRMKFATYYRESNGLDYAMNRYYSSVYGRFTTPDPFGGSANPSNPQSWNRYSYVGNDPINKNDPTGLFEMPSIEAWPTEYMPSWCATVPGYVPWSFCRIQQLPRVELGPPSQDEILIDPWTGDYYRNRAFFEAYDTIHSLAETCQCPTMRDLSDLLNAEPFKTSMGVSIALMNWFFSKGKGKDPIVIGKPKDAPPGTVPIDQSGLSKDQIHDIKDSIGAGNKDWVGYSSDGRIITGSVEGTAIDHGPWGSLTNAK